MSLYIKDNFQIYSYVEIVGKDVKYFLVCIMCKLFYVADV